MTNSSAQGPLSKQRGTQTLLLFIHHRRFFHMQPFLLHQLPLFFLDANCGAPLSDTLGAQALYSMWWQQCCVSFQGKLSNHASIQTFLPSPFFFTALPPFLPPSLKVCCHGDSHMGVLFLFVLQVQTLYYSPDHKLVDRGLMIEGQSEVFGGEEDHLHFVQVLPSSGRHGCK